MSLPVHQLPDAPTLSEALKALKASAKGLRSVRIEIKNRRPVSPLSWLAAQPSGQRLYWADRSEAQLAGWGFADVRDRLPGHGTGCYFGGMAFDPDAETTPDWIPLGRCRFFRPRLSLRTDSGEQTLSLVCLADGTDLTGVSARALSTAPADVVGHVAGHRPELSGWRAGIEKATAAFERGTMRKVVLARQTTVALETPVDPFALLSRLRQPEGFVFGFEARAGHAFLGCSPERLFRRSGKALSTEALAGTRRRGRTPPHDQALAAELRDDAKERTEHHHVVEAIEADLDSLCTELTRAKAPEIRRLQRVQHLHTPFSGTLADGVSSGELLAALHPTPAVCGRPTKAARQFIRQVEPFDRGWYAGPVGWMEDDRAEFAVAIRSALLIDGTLKFCTGAGIVAASQAEAEWSELDAKSSGIVGVLRPHRAAVGS